MVETDSYEQNCAEATETTELKQRKLATNGNKLTVKLQANGLPASNVGFQFCYFFYLFYLSSFDRFGFLGTVI